MKPAGEPNARHRSFASLRMTKTRKCFCQSTNNAVWQRHTHMGHSPSFTASAEKKGGTGVAGGAVQITPSRLRCRYSEATPSLGKKGTSKSVAVAGVIGILPPPSAVPTL